MKVWNDRQQGHVNKELGGKEEICSYSKTLYQEQNDILTRTPIRVLGNPRASSDGSFTYGRTKMYLRY